MHLKSHGLGKRTKFLIVGGPPEEGPAFDLRGCRSVARAQSAAEASRAELNRRRFCASRMILQRSVRGTSSRARTSLLVARESRFSFSEFS